jgi:predicted RNA-binding protein with TRAM domain
MQISDKLLCLFNAELTERDNEYVVRVPETEIETGSLEPDETYRVALISRKATESETNETDSSSGRRPSTEPQPPVEEGEIRYVEIEDIGKQGDGIARVERGYVIIVPGAEIGEQVKVEVSQVKSNFAVGEVIEEEL